MRSDNMLIVRLTSSKIAKIVPFTGNRLCYRPTGSF